MRSFRFRAVAGALALSGVLFAPAKLSAQATVTVRVEDSNGAALKDAAVTDSAGKLLGRTDGQGDVTFQCAAACTVRVGATGFADKTVRVNAGMEIRLDPSASTEQVTVTAYRTPLGSLESPVTTRALSESDQNSSPAVTLDGKLRQLPGVEMYRRTSSLIANPSSQGISLRGLGSTAASRTLLTEDDVPLNDPFAGWIRWQEQPELSLKSVELVRGGASDLYGSSAIGGVINLIPMRPSATSGTLKSSYGAEGTYDDSLLAQTKQGAWGLLVAGGVLSTDGYIQESPAQRGPVDIASNVHSQNGLLLAERDRGPLRLFARSNGYNDARSNGTPAQTNASRVWRYSTGGDWQGPHNGSLVSRFYGSTEHYRQIFSNISNLPTAAYPGCSYRCGESPNRFSLTPENELGAVARWTQPLGAGFLVMGGADVHDARVWDREQTYGSTAALTNLRDHQRDEGAYAEAMWVRKAWTATASSRLDWYQNYDGQQLVRNGGAWVPAAAQPVRTDQRLFDPRVGVSRKLKEHWAVSGSGFRAFREPSPNELYRTTQVGAMLTEPNFSLLSERATGWETGLATEWHWGSIRSSYFLTQVNRPITAVTINALSTPQLLMRENLGQIESKGISLDYELAPRRWLAVDGGYQYAHATVTRGTQALGNWIPEVARNTATLNLRAFQPKLGMLTLQGRISGHDFDDAANAYLLHSYFRLDAFASHDFGKRFEVFAAGENLLDRAIETGKTPTTTLAMPRVVRAGFVIHAGRAEK